MLKLTRHRQRGCEIGCPLQNCICIPFLWHTYIFPFTGCTTDILTSDHSPVFASFEVGVASQFVSKQGTITGTTFWLMECKLLWFIMFYRLPSDPNSEPEGGIQIMNCVATLLTKSKTKFFIEFYSSCLESRFCPEHCTLFLGWFQETFF